MKPRARLHSLSWPPLKDHFEIDLKITPEERQKSRVVCWSI